MCMLFDPDTYTEFHEELWTAVRENLSEEGEVAALRRPVMLNWLSFRMPHL